MDIKDVQTDVPLNMLMALLNARRIPFEPPPDLGDARCRVLARLGQRLAEVRARNLELEAESRHLREEVGKWQVQATDISKQTAIAEANVRQLDVDLKDATRLLGQTLAVLGSQTVALVGAPSSPGRRADAGHGLAQEG